jgi:hypothetical protein
MPSPRVLSPMPTELAIMPASSSSSELCSQLLALPCCHQSTNDQNETDAASNLA